VREAVVSSRFMNKPYGRALQRHRKKMKNNDGAA
jgi:hypothetical protein